MVKTTKTMKTSKKAPKAARPPGERRPAKRIAVYTGSFDPMTLGHLDVIRRASQLFDELVVAMGEARGKTPLFTIAERKALIEETCADLTNIRVESFSGLAIAFAARKHARAMVRGIRSTADYAYEVQMALMNRAMRPEIETIFLPTSPEFSHISSSLAKEIALHGGDMRLLVPEPVAQKLAGKIKG